MDNRADGVEGEYDAGSEASASEVFFALLTAINDLRMRTAPTKDEPFRVLADDIPTLPARMFALVAATENLRATDRGEVDQVLNGAATILALKTSLYAVLGWIAAQGLPTGEISQMVLGAINGPIRPRGSIAELQMRRAKLMASMGAASPAPAP